MSRKLTDEEKEVVDHALEDFGELFPEEWPRVERVWNVLGYAYRNTQEKGGDHYGHLTLDEVRRLRDRILSGDIELD